MTAPTAIDASATSPESQPDPPVNASGEALPAPTADGVPPDGLEPGAVADGSEVDVEVEVEAVVVVTTRG